MSSLAVPVDTPSLLGVTIRRSTVVGKFFLVYSTVMSGFFGVILAVVSASAFSTSFPVILPIFGVAGSMGALSVFSSDRVKGTLEYFLAYGITARRLFTNVLIAAVVLVSIIVAVAVGVGVGLYVARGHSLSEDLLVRLGLYAIPMTYASASFATIVCMYWTALSSPRTGMNSPIGIAPIIGILPPVGVLVVASVLEATGAVSSFGVDVVAVLAMVGVAVTSLLLLAVSGRLLRSERLLSPA